MLHCQGAAYPQPMKWITMCILHVIITLQVVSLLSEQSSTDLAERTAVNEKLNIEEDIH